MFSGIAKKESMRKVFLPALALAMAFALGVAVTHESVARADRENPYLTLYKLRVTQSQAVLARKQAMSTLADSKFGRVRRLLQSNAVSQEEYDTQYAESIAASADVDLAKQKVDEANAYLQIIDGLVARGVNIPLCTYEME